MKIILASASPRRKELLHQIGWEFEVCVSQVEEIITGTAPHEVVEELSYQKAMSVFEEKREEYREKEGCKAFAVIGADTVVSCDGVILTKPADCQDAVKMLKMLQGRDHSVYTGVTICLLGIDGEVKISTFHEKTQVTFYPMTDEEIQEYVETKDPMDKAGAYGIQGMCARYISRILGDYNNVVGLPAGRVYQEMRKMM